jgi:hypothetical protein
MGPDCKSMEQQADTPAQLWDFSVPIARSITTCDVPRVATRCTTLNCHAAIYSDAESMLVIWSRDSPSCVGGSGSGQPTRLNERAGRHKRTQIL